MSLMFLNSQTAASRLEMFEALTVEHLNSPSTITTVNAQRRQKAAKPSTHPRLGGLEPLDLPLIARKFCFRGTQFIKMDDFYFTIPYGLIMIAGGLIGYFKRGSTASLAGGLGSGILLLLAGFLSLKASENRRNSYFALILETGCAITLTLVMGQRYIQTSKIMPGGVVAAISALMTGFYVYKIASGGNHFPSKYESVLS